MNKCRNGLVLSGGGVRGFAHLGFVQAMKERGVEFQAYSGASAGAMVCAFLADGHEPKEAFKLFKKLGLFSYTKVHWPKTGLLTLDGLKDLLKKHISADRIEDLANPLHIAVSNLNRGKIEYIKEGPVCDWVIASSSIPVLFSPIEVNGQKYADGGLLDNLPSLPLKGDCDRIVGVNVSPLIPDDNLSTVIQVAVRTFQVSVDVTARSGKALCDLYVEPHDISKVYLLDTNSADRCFELGYNSGMAIEESELEIFH